MKLIGLTGGIATGKSTVATMLRQLGAEIIDADELAREIVRPDQEAWREIADAFGREILRADQSIDREKLRKKIFRDRQARKRLESITHPRIRTLAQQRVQQLAAKRVEIAVYVAPLLFENKVHLRLRPVILVACDPATQKRRLQNRDGLNEEEMKQHLKAQMSLKEKRKLADYVIENNGSLKELENKVQEIWEKIKSISCAPDTFLPRGPRGRDRPPE